MRRFGTPALSNLKQRLSQYGSDDATRFCAILLEANCEFLAFAVSSQGLIAAAIPTIDSVQAALGLMLLYSLNLYARDQLAGDASELLTLLAAVLDVSATDVMVRRDQLRKSPRGEEWMLYCWLRQAFGLESPRYDAAVDSAFGYQYLSYVSQYRDLLKDALAALLMREPLIQTGET